MSDTARCPYCGHEHHDMWDYEFPAHGEGEITMECGECEKEFRVARVVSVDYRTRHYPLDIPEAP